MVDKLVKRRDDFGVVRRYRDMNDGTFAEAVTLLDPPTRIPGYPDGATPVHVGSLVANNVATASMPAVPGKTNYLTGYEITGSGATLGGVVTSALTGLLGGTLNPVIGVVAGVGLINTPLVVQFAYPIPAAAVNTAITLSVPAFGLGNAACSIALHGFNK